MSVTENPTTPTTPTFGVGFILALITIAALMLHLPESCWTASRDLTIFCTKVLATGLGLTAQSAADIVTVNGFQMRIIRQCTAVDYIAILSTAILLYTRHSLVYRLFGLAVTVPLIIGANACRLVICGVVGTYSRSAFDFLHDYLWVVGFSLFVFFLWTLWVNRSVFFAPCSARRVLISILASTCAYLLLLLFRDAYATMMTSLGTLLSALLPMKQQTAIVREGSQIIYSRAGHPFYQNNMLESVSIAVYAGLMLPLQKRGDWRLAGLTLVGLVALILMGATFIALGCGLAGGSGTQGFTAFVTIGTLVQLALPLALYWIVAPSAPPASVPVPHERST